MSMFSESTEESLRKKRSVDTFNALMNKGLSLKDIEKLIGPKSAKEGIEANPYDFHWMTRSSEW